MFKHIYTGLEGKMTKKRYAVDYIMKLYEKHLKNKKKMRVDRVVIEDTDILKFAYKSYRKHGEIRCPLCNTLCSHFRMVENKLYPYCFRKSKYMGATFYTFFNIDHINPVSNGGHNGIKNKQLVCERCNQLKADAVDKNFYINKYNKDVAYFDKIFDFIQVKKEYAHIWNIIVKNSKKNYMRLLKKKYDCFDKNGNFNFRGM